MNDEDFLCGITKEFWNYYFMEPTEEHFQEMLSNFSSSLVMIGTGKHEFFTDIKQIFTSMSNILVEAKTIIFDVIDEWYECKRISDGAYLVYGGIWVKQKENEDQSIVEMDTRFTIIFHKVNDKFEIVHIHHSIPYIDQQYGEYYPKTLSEKTKEALNLAKMYEKKSELDLMTSVYNNISFKQYVSEQMLESKKGNMYLFDLDYFKDVNDNYGHVKGDEILCAFAKILKSHYDGTAIIGRMGGDEFAVYEINPPSKEKVIDEIIAMQKEFQKNIINILNEDAISFSVGLVNGEKGQYSYTDIFLDADEALYSAKRQGKNTYCWHESNV